MFPNASYIENGKAKYNIAGEIPERLHYSCLCVWFTSISDRSVTNAFMALSYIVNKLNEMHIYQTSRLSHLS